MNKYKVLRTLLISQRTGVKQICDIQAIASKLINVSKSLKIISKMQVSSLYMWTPTPRFFHVLSDFCPAVQLFYQLLGEGCWHFQL